MTPERHQQVMDILAQALESDTGQGEDVLAQLCLNDGTLRIEVERLLKHKAVAANFLEETLFGEPDFDEELLIGTSIGAYRIIEHLGSGGMGAVYLAVRIDDEYQRQVAIKFIKPGLASDIVQRRFRNERQILANLDHQNVARLFDGGTTKYGPYLVMEYVEGEAIDAYAESQNLSTVARLELFLKVCGAVEYAHRKQIVHRDIKPGNILVNSDREPKLLDFGIARLIQPDSRASEATVTWRVMTPEYASPEQVRGEPITTASDIYSLGAVLYKLLTGQSPYRLRGRGVDEMKDLICTRMPARPSTIVSGGESASTDDPRTKAMSGNHVKTANGRAEKQVARALRGDLDNIILMALRKEPDRRYASVEQFAEDIRRHLKGLPILARRDALSHRTAKFFQRQRAFVLAIAGVGLLGLFIGIAIALVSVRARVTNASISSSGSSGVITDRVPKLVGWWPGNASARDASGNGNDGSLGDGVTFAPGKINDAFKFSEPNQRVLLGKPTSLQLQEFTIEAWVKYETHPYISPDYSKEDEFAVRTIFHYGQGGYELCIFGNKFPGGNMGGGTQQIHGLYLSRQGVNHVHSGNLVVPSDENFHHVAVTKSGTTVIFYVDGVASAPVNYTDSFTFNNPAYIGDNYVGLIDELKIFDRGLSKSEIFASYSQGRPLFAQSAQRNTKVISSGG